METTVSARVADVSGRSLRTLRAEYAAHPQAPCEEDSADTVVLTKSAFTSAI